MTTVNIDLTDLEYRLNPWPTYEVLREQSPIHFVPEGTHDGEDFYVFSRYNDVSMALRDKNRFSNVVMRGRFDMPMMINRDAPEHTRLRRNANRAFNARLVLTLEDWVQTVIDEVIDDALAGDRVEWVDAVTYTLPLRVVGDMLGIPLDRKNDFRRWSQAIMNMFAVAAGLDPDEVPGYLEDLLEFGNYMTELAIERKGKANRGDILGALVEQQEAGNCTQDELAAMAYSFVAAGQETTMNLLGGGLHMLLTDKALGKRLTENPDLTGAFIDEYLRVYAPVQWTLRRTTEEVQLHGVTIPKGGLCHMVIGSANRDPRRFPDPDRLDLDRENKADHLGFGAGPHFCPGAALSELLSNLTFRAYYRILDRLSVDPAEPPVLRTSQGAYGLERLNLLVSH
ncbi:cytochrome P450 [Pseudonocardia aurantiaca]|uniref:Cytochrome P450 n=1 Tax=Pseudonocardia aurantiaca TaxID=75290 RepID=A0ABW4FT11_9PSEU